MKKLLLVRPVVEFPVDKLQELGIPQAYLHLAQYIMRKSDWEVSIIDYRLNKVLGKEINPAGDFFNFDVVGIGCSTSEFPPALKLLSIAKKLGKETVLGGIFPTQNRSYCLSYKEVDYVISGEGERVLLDLLGILSNGAYSEKLKTVNGLSFKNNCENIHNKRGKPLDFIPGITPETYSLLDLSSYAKFIPAHIMATRGCPYGCSFCSLKSIWNKTYRMRPVKEVVQEMHFLKEAGFKHIHLKDETLTANYQYAKELFSEIANEGLGIGIKIKSRIDGITDDGLLTLMKKAGVDCIHFGVETISNNLLAKIKKGGRVTSELISLVLSHVLNFGFKINPVFMIGIPSQKEEDLDLTVSYVEKLGSAPDVISYCSFWNPHPVDGIFSVDKDMNLLVRDLNRFTHKQPVAVPTSMNTFSGRKKMLDVFDVISEITKNRNVNPEIDAEYKNLFLHCSGVTSQTVPAIDC